MGIVGRSTAARGAADADAAVAAGAALKALNRGAVVWWWWWWAGARKGEDGGRGVDTELVQGIGICETNT